MKFEFDQLIPIETNFQLRSLHCNRIDINHPIESPREEHPKIGISPSLSLFFIRLNPLTMGPQCDYYSIGRHVVRVMKSDEKKKKF